MVRVVLPAAAALSLAPAAACAQVDLFSRETLHGVADVSLAAGSVSRPWTGGGSGKSGVAGEDLDLPRAAIVWTPSLGVALRGHVTVQYQPDAAPELDINEAYLEWRAPPSPWLGRVAGKAGLFYPPVSLEHTGTAWTPPDMLSGSAINTWIGEEVLVGGFEATLRRDIGDHELSATAAVFGWNDTSGTLLSFRGWALHGLTTGLDTSWKLPPRSPFMRTRQGPVTDPVLELDHRPGYYGRLEWRPPAPVSVSAIYYDNAGDRTSVDTYRQWAWETRFFNLGVRWEPDGKTSVLAQAMKGETLMGFRFQGRGPIWVDVGYRSAYVLARRELAEADVLSARLDVFETSDRSTLPPDNNDEDGWAATLAWRHRLTDHLDVIVEGQHVRSDRAYRLYAGEDPDRSETVLQTALRVSF